MQQAGRLSTLVGLAAFAMNDYYSTGPYVNSAAFQMYKSLPGSVAGFRLRRRDENESFFGYTG